jgi:hypothetical protein
MDRRKTWRDQEEQLVARWNAASERFRAAHADKQDDAVAAASAELETLRRQIARFKSEFSTGKRY